jgi:alpha-tubulin suppressor-like RCC1 family protein
MKFILTSFAIFVAVMLTTVSSPAQTVTKVVAGTTHSLFLKSDGSLWAMGYNLHGELGNGKNVNTNRPQLIVASGVADVAAGGDHSLFVKNDGSLWAMGYNFHGELGNGTYVNTNLPQMIVASGVKAVAAGEFHSLFIKTDGTIWGMGANDVGQLGTGTLYTKTNVPQQVAISGVITALAVGGAHTLFLKNDGSLWVAGYDGYGQLGDGNASFYWVTTPTQIVASGVKTVGAGYTHSFFVKNDGSLWVMGFNNYGQLGNGSAVNTNRPIQILSGGAAVGTGGQYHSLFIKTNGSLWSMGYNQYGELGDGIFAGPPAYGTNVPEQVVSSNVTSVVAGSYFTLFTKSDGSLWGFGASDQGQLGDGITLSFTNRAELIVGAPAVISGVTRSGANLIFNGINNVAGSTNYVLVTTNFTLPKNQWTRISTNVLSTLGSFTITVTNTVNAVVPGQFYLLQML